MKQHHRPTHYQHLAKIVLCFGLLIGLFGPLDVIAAPVAQAQDATNTLVQQDFDNDNIPDVTTVSASFASNRDRVTVYDTTNDMQWSEDWDVATDFNDDIWLFDARANDTVELIIVFSSNDTQTIAELYFDVTGDGDVAYELRGQRPVVTESEFPPIRVVADGDWWLENGDLNWNIVFEMDGGDVFNVDHPYEEEFQWIAGHFWKPEFELDGQVDLEHRFEDTNRDGIPEGGVWRIMDDTILENTTVSRGFMWNNIGQYDTRYQHETIFWPLLGSTDDPKLLQEERILFRYFDIFPFIPVNWALAEGYAPAWIGYPMEHGHHVHAKRPLNDDVLNYVGFENIQAYYDLAEDRDHHAEMHIRHLYHEPSQEALELQVIQTTYNDIRYSWNLNNNDQMKFDYKIGLAGRFPIDGENTIAGISYRTIPHEELPYWISEQPWDIISFVAAESNPYHTTEGIYEWSVLEMNIDSFPIMRYYIDGQLSFNPEFLYQTDNIHTGYRGEFAPDVFMAPQLYFSPIDRRLHLYRADYGVMAITEDTKVRYEDNNDDGYADLWMQLADTEELATLANTGEYMVYSERGQTIIRQVEVPPYIFMSIPPRNHDDWYEQQQQVLTYEKDFELTDFNAMFQQYDGPEWQVVGSRVRRFRYTANGGWQFELIIENNSRLIDNSLNLENAELSEGEYIVTYAPETGIVIEPVAPLEVKFSIDPVYTENVVANEVQYFTMNLENTGNQDIHNLRLAVVGVDPKGREFPIFITYADPFIYTDAPNEIELYWVPGSSGKWDIYLYVTATDPELREESFKEEFFIQLEVQPSATVERQNLLDLGDNIPYNGVLLLLLAIPLSLMPLLVVLLLSNRING